MANIDIDNDSHFPVTGAIVGTERIPMSDSGTARHVTPNLMSAWIIDNIEAISAGTTLDSGDSIMILQNDTDLVPITYEVLEDAVAETMYAESAITTIADADVFLVKDNATTKATVTAANLAVYMLAELEPSILDISDLTANAAPSDTDHVLTCIGTAPRRTTWLQLKNEVHGAFDTYLAGLATVSSTNDTDLLYCTQSGTEKGITLLDIVNHISYPINGSGAADTLANWSDADTLTNTYSVGTSFAAGDNTTLPTTKACRDEMDEIINDATAFSATIVGADTLLIDDGAAGTQRKATFTNVFSWIEDTIQALSAKTAPVMADILTIQDSADSNALKEMTIDDLFTEGLDISAITDIGAALADADEIIVDDGAGGTIRASAMSRVWTYTKAKIESVSIDGITITDANDIVLATGTGTKIGTATGQKLGFWNATPVDQQSHIGDPAAPSAQTSSAVGDLGATNSSPWGYSSEANADAVHTAIDQLVADVTQLYTAVAANNTAIDSINALCAALGLTAAS